MTFDNDASAYLASLNAQPTAKEATAYNNLFTKLKNDGNWSKLVHCMVYFTTENLGEEAALRDIVGSIDASIQGNTIEFLPLAGIGNGDGLGDVIELDVDPELVLDGSGNTIFTPTASSMGLMFSKVEEPFFIAGTWETRLMGAHANYPRPTNGIANDASLGKVIYRFYGNSVVDTSAGMVDDTLYSVEKTNNKVKGYKDGTLVGQKSTTWDASLGKEHSDLVQKGFHKSGKNATISFTFRGADEIDFGDMADAFRNFMGDITDTSIN